MLAPIDSRTGLRVVDQSQAAVLQILLDVQSAVMRAGLQALGTGVQAPLQLGASKLEEIEELDGDVK